MDHGLLPETHLGLRRVYVHIHFRSRHLNKKQNYWIHRRRQNVAIGFDDPVLNETVANQPPIHEDENRITIELLNFRLRHKAMQPHFAEIVWRGHSCPRVRSELTGGPPSADFEDEVSWTRVSAPTSPRWRLRQTDTLQRLHCRERNQLIKGLASKYLVHALAMAGYGRRHQQRIRRRVQLEMLFRMRQRIVGYERRDMG